MWAFLSFIAMRRSSHRLQMELPDFFFFLCLKLSNTFF